MLLALDFLESMLLSGTLPGGSWGSGSGPPGGPPLLLRPSDGPLSFAGRSRSLEFGGFLNLFYLYWIYSGGRRSDRSPDWGRHRFK